MTTWLSISHCKTSFDNQSTQELTSHYIFMTCTSQYLFSKIWIGINKFSCQPLNVFTIFFIILTIILESSANIIFLNPKCQMRDNHLELLIIYITIALPKFYTNPTTHCPLLLQINVSHLACLLGLSLAPSILTSLHPLGGGLEE